MVAQALLVKVQTAVAMVVLHQHLIQQVVVVVKVLLVKQVNHQLLQVMVVMVLLHLFQELQ
jgi:hypothetical protein